jgi:DNA-binding NarL/FixJ family response regulator
VPLTSREVEILQLIAEGKANKQTAAELGHQHQDGREAPADA